VWYVHVSYKPWMVPTRLCDDTDSVEDDSVAASAASAPAVAVEKPPHVAVAAPLKAVAAVAVVAPQKVVAVAAPLKVSAVVAAPRKAAAVVAPQKVVAVGKKKVAAVALPVQEDYERRFREACARYAVWCGK
jgi:hypothetical protein